MTRSRAMVLVSLASGLTLAMMGACAGGEGGADTMPSAIESAASAVAGSRWTPEPGTTWQWQLTGAIDTAVRAEVFDIDGQTTPTSVVERLQVGGSRVICYLSAGSWEAYREDAEAFPASVRGRQLDGWPGEQWLDIRRTDILLPIMEKRIAACQAKGFDGIEPDNVDGYANDSGFPLTAADQLRYNLAIAELGHEYGMSVGLKNDVEQVGSLVDHFDFAVVEECVRFDECGAWRTFIEAGKAVFHAEYEGSMETICATTGPLNLSTIKKDADLGAYRRTC